MRVFATFLLAAAVTPAPALHLSTFMAAGPNATWLQLNPFNPRERAVVATFPGSPAGARAAWSANRKRGLVWFAPYNRGFINNHEEPMPAGLTERLFLVDLPTHQTRQLSLPPVGALRDAGYDAGGAVLALTEQEIKLLEDKHGRHYVDFEGKRYGGDLGHEGLPVLVHAYRLEPDHHWQRVQTILSDTGWDYAQGVRALAAAKTLGTRTSTMLTAHPGEGPALGTGAKEKLRRMAPALHGTEGDGWVQLAGTPGPVYFWMFSGEFTYATGRIAFDTGAKTTLAPGLPWSSRDTVALNRHGASLLATCAGSGSHPRLWDVPTRKLVFVENQAWDTVFWPD
ncbi:MAG: hypothetical protein JWM80_4244 [Cyanobacteria bacterium RYN_339]|nr:hypothetical protein [Cyanobacteria bacterium RYN_339]